jgi:hypothetical protein
MVWQAALCVDIFTELNWKEDGLISLDQFSAKDKTWKISHPFDKQFLGIIYTTPQHISSGNWTPVVHDSERLGKKLWTTHSSIDS